ncbi:MAG: ceramidase domain-containing protein [Hyphomicrobiaceae bacterium]
MDWPGNIVWSEKIFSYCERSGNPGFWAEPFNAISNGAFLFASLAALIAWARMPSAQRGLTELGLIALVAVIGTGSFLFHTIATRWTAIADIAPIGAFMLLYAIYALRRFTNLNWFLVAAGVGLFGWLMQLANSAPCPMALRGLVAGRHCLNGTLLYLPAFAMLTGVGVLAAIMRHPSAKYLLTGSAILAVSLAARSLDQELCPVSSLWGKRRGTHALWHLLNATMLALMLLAAVRHGRRDGAQIG